MITVVADATLDVLYQGDMMAKVVKATAAEATERWVEKLSNAQAKIEAGVNRVQTAPGVAAAAAANKYLTGVQESVNKWRSRVAAVSLQEWQQAMKEIGISRIATGAQAKKGKFEAFMNEFLPQLERNLQQVDAMPSGTYEQRKQRAIKMMDLNHAFKRGTGGVA